MTIPENNAFDSMDPSAKRLRAFTELGLGLPLCLRPEEPTEFVEQEPHQSPIHKYSDVTSQEVLAPRRTSLLNVLSGEVDNLDALQARVASCEACGLCKTRTQTVFAAGNPLAKLAIVGEAPGAEEDRTGQAFVGQAGQLLDSMLASLGLNRAQDAYICNVLKCRPPNNRDPKPEEVAKCEPFLQNQLSLVQPKMILVVGRFAAQSLLRTEASIASLRGKVHRYTVAEREIPVVVTYHPAYLLRNLGDKAKTWADLCFLRAEMAKLLPT
jgi:uracil-DNA glycosylase